MKKRKKITITKYTLIILGTIILPIFSFYLGSRASLLYENITYIGNMKTYHTPFIIWGILNSLYYMISYLIIISNFPNLKSKTKPICIILTIISILAFLSPYTLRSADFLSQFHVYGSMTSAIGTIMLIIYTIIYGQMYYPEHLTKMKNQLLALAIFCSMLLVTIGDISTLLELILLNGLNYIMAYLLYLFMS